MSTTYLKVKVKTLAIEANIIRKEERKHLAAARNMVVPADHLEAKLRSQQRRQVLDEAHGLHHHRITVVRSEARSTHLALAACRGRKYSNVERTCHDGNLPDWNRVGALIKKYGGRDWQQVMLDFQTEEVAPLTGV